MPQSRSGTATVILSLAACTSGARIPPGTTSPATPTAITSSKGTIDATAKVWVFAPRNEGHTYRSTSTTLIQLEPDPANRQDVVSVTVEFTLKVNQSETPTAISGQIESISISSPTPKAVSSQSLPNTPFSFNGTARGGNLSIDLTSAAPHMCNNPSRAILGEIRTGVIVVPLQLSLGSAWNDTLSAITCSGSGIPSTLDLTRSYKVTGQTNYAGAQVIVIERAELAHISGTGSQGQHQLQLEGAGTGSTKIYIDPRTAATVNLEGHQEFKVTVKVSGQSQDFRQVVDQRLSLVR